MTEILKATKKVAKSKNSVGMQRTLKVCRGKTEKKIKGSVTPRTRKCLHYRI